MFRFITTAAFILCFLFIVLTLSSRWSGERIRDRLLIHKESDGLGFIDVTRQLSERLTSTAVDLTSAEQLQWSPEGGRLAFVSERRRVTDSDSDIFVLSLADLSIRNLSDAPSDDLDPEWSPDGHMLAYVAWTQGAGAASVRQSEIRVVDVDSGELVDDLTQAGGNNIAPSWSPDGHMLVFGSQQPPGTASNAELRVMDVRDGTIVPGLTQTLDFRYDWSWSQSPENPWLAYSAGYQNSIGIYTMDVSSQEVRRVFSDVDPNGSRPVWSPDSRQIAFTTLGATDAYPEHRVVLHILDVNSGNDYVVSPNGESFRSPSWSPDGRWLVFMGQTDGALYCMDQHDGDIYMLVPPEYHPHPRVTWSPGGQWMAFVSTRVDRRDIYTLNMTDLTIMPLTDGGFNSVPIWQP